MIDSEKTIEQNADANAARRLVEFGAFSFDTGEKILFKTGETVQLPPKACELLSVLIENVWRVMSKEELIGQVWANTFVEEANLTHHISALLKALGEGKNGRKFIETIPRKGYRFIAPVREKRGDATEITVSERVTKRVVEEFEVDPAAEIREMPRADSTTGGAGRLIAGKKSAPRRLAVGAAVLLFAFALIGFAAYQFFNSQPTEFRAGKLIRLTSTG